MCAISRCGAQQSPNLQQRKALKFPIIRTSAPCFCDSCLFSISKKAICRVCYLYGTALLCGIFHAEENIWRQQFRHSDIVHWIPIAGLSVAISKIDFYSATNHQPQPNLTTEYMVAFIKSFHPFCEESDKGCEAQIGMLPVLFLLRGRAMGRCATGCKIIWYFSKECFIIECYLHLVLHQYHQEKGLQVKQDLTMAALQLPKGERHTKTILFVSS